MNLEQVDAIEYWLDKIKETDNGSRYAARKYAMKYKEAGYSPETALESLISDDFSIDAAEGAITDVYGSQGEESSRFASKNSSKPIIPASYSEVAPVVEDSLRKLGAAEFITRLCKSQNPIVKMSSKSINKLANLAQEALADRTAMNMLHDSLAPWFEESMLNSVLLAENMKARVMKSKAEDGKFKVVTSQESAVVNMRTATSTGKRFVEGNFSDFGLADEYMVCVSEELTPEFHLRKALNI